MARYTGPVCKLCRREGQKLFLKGAEVLHGEVSGRSPELSLRDSTARRRPGGGSSRTTRSSLREKQKVKRIYGLHEKQFRNALRARGPSRGRHGREPARALESRLDNVVFRMGFARAAQARQLVRHRHVTVNGRMVDVPSYHVQPGTTSPWPSPRTCCPVQASLEARTRPSLVEWLALDEKSRVGRVVRGRPGRM
jgi:small subunit ribosomal protein S4